MSVITAGKDKVASLVAESIYDNPVVTRELRTRMRGLKAFLVMGGYVLLIGAILFIAYMMIWNEFARPAYQQWSMSLANRNVGMRMFVWLTWTQAILLSLVIPALTFSSITQELERKSMELLALTRLTPGKIVVGKQLSGFLYTIILLVCSLPLASMCLMFGGISPAEIAVMYSLLVAWAFLLSSVGVFWSSLFNRTASAALFGYGTMGLYFLFSMPFGVASAHVFGGVASTAHPFAALNPGWASYTCVMSTSVCGVTLPVALIAAVLHIALGTLMLLVASTHVKHLKARRSVPIKLLSILITLAIVWLVVGGLSPMMGRPGSSGQMANVLGIAGAVVLAFLCLMAAIFATGEVRRRSDQSVFAYALSIHRVLAADLGGAISFMAAWAVALCAGLLGTAWWMAKAQHIKVDHGVWEAGIRLAVAIVAIVIGVSAIGVLGSCSTRVRRNAAALVLLFVILAWSGYGIVLAYYVDGITKTNGPVWQLAALWPMTPVIAMGDWAHMPKLWWSHKVSWLVCGWAYLAIAVAALAVASGPVSRIGGVKEE